MKSSVAKSAAWQTTRHLAIEQLEPRTYLAGEVIYVSSEDIVPATYVTSISQDAITKLYSFANPSPEFVVTPNSYSLLAIRETLNLNDPTLRIAAKPANDQYTSFQIQTFQNDSTTAGLWIGPAPNFTGGQVLVGIRHAGDPDSAPWLATQVITITVLKPDPVVDLSLTATTPDGAPLDELHVGDDFVLHVWAQDIRKDPHGVFAAYMNLNWDSSLASTGGQATYGEYFSNGISGSSDAPGVIENIGGFGGSAEIKGRRLEVFSVPMHATAAGEMTITSSPVHIFPQYNILEYGNDSPINISAVQYGKLSIHVADAPPGKPPEDTTNVQVTEPIRTLPDTETPAVDLSLSATTESGLPINDLHVGDNFILHVWAQDPRTKAHGVFAAYLNLNWDSSLASLAGNTSHGEHFINGKKDGDAAPGSLDRAGGFDGGISETKSNRFEVFSVPMHASASGELSIATSSAVDGTPLYWILEYGIDGEIPLNAIQFGRLSIHVAAGSAGQASPNTADGPTFDPQTSPENETSTIPQTAIPTIIVTAPTDSIAASITVNIRDLFSAELKAAIASRAALSPVLNTDNASKELESTAKLELSLL